MAIATSSMLLYRKGTETYTDSKREDQLQGQTHILTQISMGHSLQLGFKVLVSMLCKWSKLYSISHSTVILSAKIKNLFSVNTDPGRTEQHWKEMWTCLTWENTCTLTAMITCQSWKLPCDIELTIVSCIFSLLLFFFYVLSYICGVHHFWWGFCVCDCFFFYPTIEVVTFHLRGWCMLGVFLLPAFTHLGHECQDLWVHTKECMCAQTTPRFILSSKRVLGNGVRAHVNATGKILSTRKNFFRGESNPCHCTSSMTVSPKHYQRAIPDPILIDNYLKMCTVLQCFGN